MEKQFTQFLANIRLTQNQEDDAKTKYEGVCAKLHTYYYSTIYNGSTKLLFGSYKTKTNVRPITEKQDVDLLFKIPPEVYEKFKAYKSNGPASLLQEIKNILKEKYTTTEEIKAWGKVVLIKFSDHTHNVEVLPAFEEVNGTYTIPNSANDGSWDNFNPKIQINNYQISNVRTKGLAGDLTRMIKTWVDNTTTLNYSSYQIVEDVICFLETSYCYGANYSEYPELLQKYFNYLSKKCPMENRSYVEKAIIRAANAIQFELDEKQVDACEEWRKIFGNNGRSEFPKYQTKSINESATRIFINPSSPYGYS